jgi:signal transduction histidine kinase
VLVRQLLDNLIGNAVKYTAPGAAPEITITSAPTADGRIRVEVTDRGIGIPPGQHEAIFGNFHRAHRGEAYTGTGLGLTICERIVERHGGTIVATDNPAGPGTRVSFTLPAASTRASAPGEPVPTST